MPAAANAASAFVRSRTAASTAWRVANGTMKKFEPQFTSCGACGPPIAEALEGILPRLVFCDPEAATLAVELYPDAVPLWDHFHEAGPASFPASTCRALGRALGTFHAAFRSPDADALGLGWLPRGIPWALSAHQPGPELLGDARPGFWVLPTA